MYVGMLMNAITIHEKRGYGFSKKHEGVNGRSQMEKMGRINFINIYLIFKHKIKQKL